MSDSAESPGSSLESPPPPVGKDSPPGDTQSPPSDTPPTPPSEGSSPPIDGEAPPPPDSSTASPPPDDDPSSSPPPPDSKSSPPSPPSNSESSSPPPPSESGSSPPPPDSDSSTPPPPSRSESPKPSPPADSGSSAPPPSHNSSSSSPPSPPGSLPVAIPPPAVPDKPSSPPSGTPPPSEVSFPPPPARSLPAPAAPPGASNTPPVQAVSPPLRGTPPGPISPPNFPNPPPEVSNRNPTPSTDDTPPTSSTTTPPTSRASNHVPKLSPPSTESNTVSSTHAESKSPSKSNSSSGNESVVGVTVAGVLIVALVALFFVVSRRRKRRAEACAAQYKQTPNNFSVKSDGYYYGQHYTVGVSGQSDAYYGIKPPPSPSAIANGQGSHRGNVNLSGTPDSGIMGGAKSWFSYEEMTEITNGFSQQNILGQGGFGCVYKGWLPDGRIVAVKELKAGSGQGEREFRAEVEIISRVHHRYLVSLVGYCIAEHHRLLVYEFVPNQTLEHHLHGKGLPVMEWAKRVKIAIGAARGLAYLHEDCHPKIIHRDIKSANILLDDAFEAQVADFGLAKLSNDTHTHVSTRVMGTFGYMAPEYASSGKLTDRSDVFSFGVVLLELITGRKSVDPTQPLGEESLVEWARPLLIRALETGDFKELADPRLENRYVESEMFRMIEAAAACVRHSAPKRPRMAQVVRALDTEAENSDLSNGVKFGQSTIFASGQYNSEIQRFKRMAFGSDDSSEYGTYSGDHTSREGSRRPPRNLGSSSSEFPSGESETHAIINPRRVF